MVGLLVVLRFNATLIAKVIACEKSSRLHWKEKLCQYMCEKARKHMCVTELHDMTLAVKVAFDLNTTSTTNSYGKYIL